MSEFLLAAAGNLTSGEATYVEDVFSTYLYSGDAVSKTIETGLNIGDTYDGHDIVFWATGEQNVTGLVDNSPYSHYTVKNGGVAKASTSKFRSTSLQFDGSGDYFTSASDNYVFGTGDFTIDFWARFSNVTDNDFPFQLSTSSTYYTSSATPQLTLQIYANKAYFHINTFSSSPVSPTFSNDTWYHIAIARENGTTRCYFDGSQVGSDISDTANYTGKYLAIGRGYGTPYDFNGYLEDFRIIRGTALYTGASYTVPTTAPSDLSASESGLGGLSWIKNRDANASHVLVDTERGIYNVLSSDLTTAQAIDRDTTTSFHNNSFTIGTDVKVNTSGQDYVSWTFRKAPKFFDIVTYVGSSAPQTISHNLGSVPGCIIVKDTTAASDWYVYHRGIDATAPEDYRIYLNSTAARNDSPAGWYDTAPTDTEFTVGSGQDTTGNTYVAYLFAHNDGDGEFGEDADQDIIKCGSYTGNGAANGPEIDLGFEPQWILAKNAEGAADWLLFDTMRGWPVTNDNQRLRPNLSAAEDTRDYYSPTSTGFKVTSSTTTVNGSNTDYIYIAIRRGPMKTPESGTEVFAPEYGLNASAGGQAWSAGFPVDMYIRRNPAGGTNYIASRMTGNGPYMATDSTAAETSLAYSEKLDNMDGVFTTTAYNYTTWISWMFRRAPGFFDVVAYEGTGSATTVSHNLGVAPELIITKKRSATSNWATNDPSRTNPWDGALLLNGTQSFTVSSAVWNNTAPTSTVFTVGSADAVNISNQDYIAYLFATLPGVSKVGSVTFDSSAGQNQVVDCGFANGARFILFKEVTLSGYDWWVVDTERGLVAGNDNFLRLNDTSSELTTFDGIDPNSSGFELSTGNFWGSSVTWNLIYLAIA